MTQKLLEEEYNKLKPTYESLSEKIKEILEHAIPKSISIYLIENRAKSVSSFIKKSKKIDNNNCNKLKYSDPLQQITDLAGVRVIAFFPKSIPEIGKAIESEFEIISVKDLGEERFFEGKFGYKSIHYLVKFPNTKIKWAEYRLFDGYIAEIQVRTILQHAWAEMEHDIQYKSSEQIPTSIQRRFLALAGMIEIADREFQAIQDEDSKIRSTVSTSLQDDLIENETNEKQEAQIVKSKIAKDLMISEDYSKAVEYYSQLIKLQPESYTVYIGRAKALFLNGDRVGALKDLSMASTLNKNDPAIERLKVQIEDGVITNIRNTTDGWQLSAEGNRILASGKGKEAFKKYSQAQALGFNPIFSSFNKAMACALSKEVENALYFLNIQSPLPDSPTEINWLGLKAITEYIGQKDFEKSYDALDKKLKNLPGFDFNQSPLRHLREGFIAQGNNLPKKLNDIFELMNKNL